MLTVVTGPPCGGKTTHVAQNRGKRSVVVDLDALSHALGHPKAQPKWGSGHPAVSAAHEARNAVIKAALTGALRSVEVWVIDSRPASWRMRQYREARARFVEIDPGIEVCMQRASERGKDAAMAVEEWYA